jgi:hypothetical protein
LFTPIIFFPPFAAASFSRRFRLHARFSRRHHISHAAAACFRRLPFIMPGCARHERSRAMLSIL